MDITALIDVYASNAQFTWSNLRADPTLSKFDRFFVFVNWENHFSHMKAMALTISISGHKPILLRTSSRRVTQTQFRIERYWFKEEDFMDTVSMDWGRQR